MKITTIISCLLISASCFSQSKKTPDVFETAYVVTLKGDTLRGQLKMPKLNKHEIYQKISFRDKANKVKMFLPDKIKGYSFGGYFYKSAFFENKPAFFKVLSDGTASLYLICFELNENGEKVEIHDFCVKTEEKGEEKLTLLEQKGLKKQLKDIFKSNKPLVQKIGEQKEIACNAETLESYFKEFNAEASAN
jgi:hypothetical protein